MFQVGNHKVEFKLGHRESINVLGVNLLVKDITLCFIKEGDKNVAIGASVRSPSDKNKMVSGRKKALSRALEDFDEETREEFWEAFKAKYPNYSNH